MRIDKKDLVTNEVFLCKIIVFLKKFLINFKINLAG